jgi:hypothetical protein
MAYRVINQNAFEVVSGGVTYDTIAGSQTLPSYAPACAAFAWESGRQALSVRGTADGTHTNVLTAPAGALTWRLGHRRSTPNAPFNGEIHFLEISNRVATDTQLQLASRGILP